MNSPRTKVRRTIKHATPRNICIRKRKRTLHGVCGKMAEYLIEWENLGMQVSGASLLPWLRAALFRLLGVFVVGVLLSRFRSFSGVLALVTPPTRRFGPGSGTAHSSASFIDFTGELKRETETKSQAWQATTLKNNRTLREHRHTTNHSLQLTRTLHHWLMP